MDYGIPKAPLLISLIILTLTMLVIGWTASQHQAHAISSDDLWSVGPRRNRTAYLSTAEAEYIAAGSCCAQLLWMKRTLKDYGINVKNVPLYCNNESAIKIAHNLVQHSKTKHIQIRHHFLRDHVLKGDILIGTSIPLLHPQPLLLYILDQLLELAHAN